MPARIDNVAVLRFIASLTVLISHSQHEVGDQAFLHSDKFHNVNIVAWIGRIDLFFVISGFIMYYIIRNDPSRVPPPSKFLIDRSIKIVPFYWLFTILMVIAILCVPSYLAHSDLRLSDLAQSLLFIAHRNAYGEYYPIFIGGWSLNFEMMFYVVIFFCLAVYPERAMLLASMFMAALSIPGFLADSEAPTTNAWASSLHLEFSLGIAIGWAWARGWRLSSVAASFLASTALGLMLASGYSGLLHHGNLRGLTSGVPATMLVAAAALSPALAPTRFTKILILGGAASYMLYLTHPFVIGVTTVVFDMAGLSHPALFQCLCIVASVAFAFVAHLVFERPTLQTLRRVRRYLRREPLGRADSPTAQPLSPVGR